MLSFIAYAVIPVYTLMFVSGTNWFTSNLSVIGSWPGRRTAFFFLGILIGLYYLVVLKRLLSRIPRHSLETGILNTAFLLLLLAPGLPSCGICIHRLGPAGSLPLPDPVASVRPVLLPAPGSPSLPSGYGGYSGSQHGSAVYGGDRQQFSGDLLHHRHHRPGAETLQPIWEGQPLIHFDNTETKKQLPGISGSPFCIVTLFRDTSYTSDMVQD